MTPACFVRATILAEAFSGQRAVDAGFLDQLVPPGELLHAAHAKARELVALNRAAHTATKLRVRAATLAALREGHEADKADWRAAYLRPQA